VKLQGTVTKVVEGRGFYFITGDDGIQYFLHISEMEKAGLNEPAVGARLAFDVQANSKGPRAINVEVA
jgi:cold shock CspA family protein